MAPRIGSWIEFGTHGNDRSQERDHRRRRDGLGRGLSPGAAGRAGRPDRAIRPGPRPGQLARGGADHAALVRRSAIRPADARGLPRLEGARSRRRASRSTSARAASRSLRRVSTMWPRSPRTSRNSACPTGGPRAGSWNQRHPVFALPADYDVVFEPDAGMLAAARAVRAPGRAGPAARRRRGRGSSSRPRCGASTWTAAGPSS